MDTPQRRVGARKNPLRPRHDLSRGRRVGAVAPDRQRQGVPTVRQSNEDVLAEEEEILARLMPATWRRKSTCQGTGVHRLWPIRYCLRRLSPSRVVRFSPPITDFRRVGILLCRCHMRV